jgi:hypothetical protein
MNNTILRDYLEQAILLLLEVQEYADEDVAKEIEELISKIDLEMEFEELDEDLPEQVKKTLNELKIKTT